MKASADGAGMLPAHGLIALGLAVVLVAGCSKAGPEREPDMSENTSEMASEPAPPPVAAEQVPMPEPEPVANTADALPPEEDPSREAQMLEDADATGLTARTSRSVDPDETSTDPIGDLVENGGVAH